jgi:hypothetical protein
MDEKLFDEIKSRDNTLPRRPAGFGITFNEYAKAQNKGIGRDAARRLLLGLEAEGILESRNMIENNGRIRVFARPSDWSKIQ